MSPEISERSFEEAIDCGLLQYGPDACARCQIIEGHVLPDQVHMCIAIPPKHPVASVIGFLKGKSAIAVARQLCGRERNFTGEHLWARGYAVSTVGFELNQVRQYIRAQEEADGFTDRSEFRNRGAL
ncbi:MAG: IS200/IS605 family transposase [Syntrophaceae bacterium]|nr:IS200/IS605 family transposase [Syntrophaceae bacterium]